MTTCMRKMKAYDVYKNGKLVFHGSARQIADEIGCDYCTVSRYTRSLFVWHGEYTFKENGHTYQECLASGGRVKHSIMPIGRSTKKRTTLLDRGLKWKQYVEMFKVGDMTEYGKVIQTTPHIFVVQRGNIIESYSWVDMMIGVNTDGRKAKDSDMAYA